METQIYSDDLREITCRLNTNREVSLLVKTTHGDSVIFIDMKPEVAKTLGEALPVFADEALNRECRWTRKGDLISASCGTTFHKVIEDINREEMLCGYGCKLCNRPIKGDTQ